MTNKNKFIQKGKEVGGLVAEKDVAYGESIKKTNKLLRVYLEDYYNGDGTYTIPDSLLDHLGLMVRMMDKQNRIFSNPNGDLMNENGYDDIIGYGIQGSFILDKKV